MRELSNRFTLSNLLYSICFYGGTPQAGPRPRGYNYNARRDLADSRKSPLKKTRGGDKKEEITVNTAPSSPAAGAKLQAAGAREKGFKEIKSYINYEDEFEKLLLYII